MLTMELGREHDDGMTRALVFHFLVILWAIQRSFAADYPVQPVPFTAVHITGGFWQARQETNRLVTVPYAFQQCEETKRLRNFDLAAETMKRRATGETNFQNKPLTI